MAISLSEIKTKNKEAGQHFFDRGNPSVVAHYGNYLVTGGFGDGWVVYKFDANNSHINLVDNPKGAYSWEPYTEKKDAMNYARELNKKDK